MSNTKNQSKTPLCLPPSSIIIIFNSIYVWNPTVLILLLYLRYQFLFCFKKIISFLLFQNFRNLRKYFLILGIGIVQLEIQMNIHVWRFWICWFLNFVLYCLLFSNSVRADAWASRNWKAYLIFISSTFYYQFWVPYFWRCR